MSDSTLLSLFKATSPASAPNPVIVAHFSNNAGLSSIVSNYTAATQYFIQPPPGQKYKFHTIVAFLQDATAISAAGYGAMSALSNGISLKTYTASGASVKSDILAGHVVKTTAEWAHFFYDLNPVTYGIGDTYFLARWRVKDSCGVPIELNGDNFERLALTVHDDMTGLSDQQFIAQGYIV